MLKLEVNCHEFLQAHSPLHERLFRVNEIRGSGRNKATSLWEKESKAIDKRHDRD